MRGILAALALSLWVGSAYGIGYVGMPPQDLFDQSDLVVIAHPSSTKDLPERRPFFGQSSIGIETDFHVKAVLKGDRRLKHFVLHHYRFAPDMPPIMDGPLLVQFNPLNTNSYLLFLVQEPDGRYRPTSEPPDSGDATVPLARGYR